MSTPKPDTLAAMREAFSGYRLPPVLAATIADRLVAAERERCLQLVDHEGFDLSDPVNGKAWRDLFVAIKAGAALAEGTPDDDPMNDPERNGQRADWERSILKRADAEDSAEGTDQ